MEYTQEQNRALCEAYPFLDRNRRWGAKDCPDGPKPGVPEDLKEWDYEYTELDCMPDGWRIAFGEQLCAELKAELERAGILDHTVFCKSKRNTAPFDGMTTATPRQDIRF